MKVLFLSAIFAAAVSAQEEQGVESRIENIIFDNDFARENVAVSETLERGTTTVDETTDEAMAVAEKEAESIDEGKEEEEENGTSKSSASSSSQDSDDSSSESSEETEECACICGTTCSGKTNHLYRLSFILKNSFAAAERRRRRELKEKYALQKALKVVEIYVPNQESEEACAMECARDNLNEQDALGLKNVSFTPSDVETQAIGICKCTFARVFSYNSIPTA